MTASRLTDNDRRLGSHITYGHSKGWRPIGVAFHSGGEDEGFAHNHLMLYALGWSVRIQLPRLTEPYREKVQAGWSAETVARMGRDWYWSVDDREYGFRYSDGFLQVFLGRQTGDSSTTKSWSKTMPWMNWHQRRISYYGLDGEELRTWLAPYGSRGMFRWDERYEYTSKELPRARFEIEDFDGARIVASTYIEETEYTWGERRWSWLRFFRPNRVRRNLDISFDREVGPEKGSWKGGLMGTGIAMLPGELHEAAMRRYCELEHRDRSGSYRIKFIGKQS